MGNNREQHQDHPQPKICGLRELREFYGIDKKEIYDLYRQYIGICADNSMPLEKWIQNVVQTSKGEKILNYLAVMGLNIMSMEVGTDQDIEKRGNLLQ